MKFDNIFKFLVVAPHVVYFLNLGMQHSFLEPIHTLPNVGSFVFFLRFNRSVIPDG